MLRPRPFLALAVLLGALAAERPQPGCAAAVGVDNARTEPRAVTYYCLAEAAGFSFLDQAAPAPSQAQTAAPESLGQKLLGMLGRFFGFANGGVPSAIAAAILFRYHKQIRQWRTEWKESRDEKKVYIWNLIPRRKSKRGNAAVALLKAINQGAVDAAAVQFDATRLKTDTRPAPAWSRALKAVRESVPFALRPYKARQIWEPQLPRLRNAQTSFVSPGCRVEEYGDTSDSAGVDGIDAIRQWLEQSASATTDESAGKIWVLASGSSGKTIFMNRLFLDLIGATDADSHNPRSLPDRKTTIPVPMLASAENLRGHGNRIDTLNREKDVVSAFATVWLENRNIEMPDDVTREDILKSLAKDLKAALTNGEVVLLLDGVDELGHQGLDRFAKNLLDEVRFWVASNRPGNEMVPTNHAVTLDDVWRYEQIAQRLDRRFPDPAPGAKPSPMVKSREILKNVIRELIEDHEKSVDEGVTDQEHHWLCHPGNLGPLLDAMDRERITDEHEIRRLAGNQSHLFRMIFKNAVHGIGADGDIHDIERRLFDLAAADPTGSRPRTRGNVARAHDPTDKEVLLLKQIIRETREGPVFRHAAFRDYFIAGRIASEIVDRSVEEEGADELALTEAWDSATRDAVLSWLKEESASKPAQHIRSRLRRRGDSGSSAINPTMRRNLVDLLLHLDRDGGLDHLDLSSIPGARLDLHLMSVTNCRFDSAVLVDAELAEASFANCDFSGADLSGADAFRTKFERCSFDVAGSREATVNGLAIAEGVFVPGDGSDQRELLMDRGARDERSRYRGLFGKVFADAQSALLGPGLERLEKGAYLQAIKHAVRDWEGKEPGAPVYLVDLMAGGSYHRVTDLLAEFENLHILGIDKDPSAQKTGNRFAWAPVEIGRGEKGGQSGLGLDIRTALTEAFGPSAFPAHVIVAKKAMHELRRSDDPARDLQPALMRLCAESLRPGGRLILFEDAPGPESERDLNRGMLKEIHSQLDSLRAGYLSQSASDAATVGRALAGLTYDGSETSQIGFVNTWIMLKDWANQNRHEVQNRYFASVAEIRGWASGIFADCKPIFDNYRLNPLIFNELGLQTVLDHVEREVARAPGKTTAAAVIRNERKQLQSWITESDRLKVLVDFSRDHLADDSPLGRALDAAQEPISLAKIDPVLAPLDTGERAWSFNLRCAVLVFEKA